MAVPVFSAYLDPLLAALGDGELHRNADLKREAAERLHLSAEDLVDLVPSGKKTRHNDRTYWAITYLFQAGLVERPGRGLVRISSRGKAVLDGTERPITLATLEQFDEFRQFKERKREDGEAIPQDALDVATVRVTPMEAVADLVDSVNDAVARELLLRVIAQTPDFLERLILRLLRALGYGGFEAASEHLGGPGDQGLDGVIRQDVLGLDVVYVQAKRYGLEHKVGRPDIQAFVGALTGAQATRGVFMTTSSFTPEARAYADRVGLRLVLIDGRELTRLMVERNIGVSVEETFDLKRIDEDFFDV